MLNEQQFKSLLEGPAPVVLIPRVIWTSVQAVGYLCIGVLFGLSARYIPMAFFLVIAVYNLYLAINRPDTLALLPEGMFHGKTGYEWSRVHDLRAAKNRLIAFKYDMTGFSASHAGISKMKRMMWGDDFQIYNSYKLSMKQLVQLIEHRQRLFINQL